jgi:hypothetical protein
MTFSTFATVAVTLAVLAVLAAVATGVLVVARRRRWAHGALTVMVVLLAGSTLSALTAATRNENDLAGQSRTVLSLAARAERITHARSGRYTTSVVHLWHVSPRLAGQMRLDGASLSAQTRHSTRSVRLHVFLGAYNPPAITLHAIAR